MLEAVRGTGAEVVEFGTVIPPMTWPNETTPLMTAATLGRADLVADLIERGAPVGETDDVGATALHHAAHAGRDDAVDVLVGLGADTAQLDGKGRTPADLARLGGHRSLADRIDVVREDIRFGAGALVKWVYLLLGAGGLVVLGLLVGPGLDMPWSLLTLALVAGTIWVYRYLPASGAPLRLSADDVLHVLTWRGTVRVPLHEVRGVIAVPAHGVRGAPWQVVLCQDLVGRRSTVRSLRRVQPSFVHVADAERCASVAERHVVLVLGRGGASTPRVLAALRRPLSRPDVVSNEVWQLLEHHTPAELFQR